MVLIARRILFNRKTDPVKRSVVVILSSVCVMNNVFHFFFFLKYTHTHIYVYIYIYTHTCMYVYIYKYIYIYISHRRKAAVRCDRYTLVAVTGEMSYQIVHLQYSGPV